MEKGREYAIPTDEINRAWSGMTARQYKRFKGLKKENLWNNMSDLELVLNMLAEASTTSISRAEQPEGLEESRKAARRGGRIAGNARRKLEQETGWPVMTAENAQTLQQLVTGVVEGAEKRVEAGNGRRCLNPACDSGCGHITKKRGRNGCAVPPSYSYEGNVYLLRSSTNRMSMVATWARVANPCGISIPASFPLMTPVCTAQFMACVA